MTPLMYPVGIISSKFKCLNLTCRVDKDADGRINEEEIKEVWDHVFTSGPKLYFLNASTNKINTFFKYVFCLDQNRIILNPLYSILFSDYPP